MQASVESTPVLEHRMTVGMPIEHIETEINKRLQQTARCARIPGLHPGRVPMSVIRQRYETPTRQEAMGNLVQETSYETAVEQKLNPAGSPSVEFKSFGRGKDLEYIVAFGAFPRFTVSGLEDIKAEYLQAEVSDADASNILDVPRKWNTCFEVVERAVRSDGQLNIDFVGKISGEAFAGGSAKGILPVLGSDYMIAGFKEGLTGAKAGEECVLNLTFPEDYRNLNLTDEAAEFIVTVNNAAGPKLLELNRESFALFGIKEVGLDDLRAEVQKNMGCKSCQAIKSKVKNQVMGGPLQTSLIEVPKALIGNEVNRLRVQAVQRFGGNVKPGQLPAELSGKQTKRRAVLGLIVVEAVKQHELKADGDRVRETIEEMAPACREPKQVVAWYFKNEPQLNEVYSVVLEEQVVDTVLQKTTVTDKQVSCEEAVKSAEAPQVAWFVPLI